MSRKSGNHKHKKTAEAETKASIEYGEAGLTYLDNLLKNTTNPMLQAAVDEAKAVPDRSQKDND